MATTAPATSITSFCIISTCLSSTHGTSITAGQLAVVTPSATPAPWETLTRDPTPCGCGCTETPPYTPGILMQRKGIWRLALVSTEVGPKLNWGAWSSTVNSYIYPPKYHTSPRLMYGYACVYVCVCLCACVCVCVRVRVVCVFLCVCVYTLHSY